MADTKISALTSATTPLAGTEVLPIVQSGTTKKVAVSDLTAGRNIAGSGLTLTKNAQFALGAESRLINYFGSAGSAAGNTYQIDAATAWVRGVGDGPNSGAAGAYLSFGASSSGVDGTEQARLYGSGNFSLLTGNLIQGTAAKGVNFTANTPAAGMTSQLLNWYEEGTWTPNQGAAVSVVGAYSSSGTYTRVGRTVTITAMQSGATSISTSPSGIIFSNLPFTVGGGVTRYSGTTALQFSGVAGAIAVGGTTNVYSCGTLSGGDTIVTTLTYEV